MNVHVLPLAITMMAGPQFISAIIFATMRRPVATSGAFVAGVAAATAAGTAGAWGLALALGNAVQVRGTGRGTAGTIIVYVLVGLLVLAALRNYLKRATVEPPAWLRSLMGADPRKAAGIGLLVILLMPSDIIVMLTVGTDLVRRHTGYGGAVPFIAATTFIAALPLLLYLLMRRRAARLMPAVRDWLNTHSWLVNIICCGVFVVLLLSGG